MARYLVVLRDWRGLTRNSMIIACASDEDALAAAKAALDRGEAAEVWMRSRLVGRVKAKRLADTPLR